MKAHDEIGAVRLGLLQKVQMTDMKEIKGPRHVHDLVVGLGPLLVGELEDLLGGGQELGQAGPGGPGAGVRAHVPGGTPVHLVLLVAALKMILAHEQHPSHTVGRGDALGPLALLGAPGRLHDVVGICPISSHGDVITMNTEIALIPTKHDN